MGHLYNFFGESDNDFEKDQVVLEAAGCGTTFGALEAGLLGLNGSTELAVWSGAKHIPLRASWCVNQNNTKLPGSGQVRGNVGLESGAQ